MNEQKGMRRIYTPHPHRAVSVNGLREHEQKVAGINQRIAILITKALGSVPCMYFFIILALIGFPGFHATLPQYVQWFSQTCIQLVALSVLGISQNILNHHTELQSDAMYDTDIKTFSDVETLIAQNNKQFEMLEAQNKVLETHYLELLRQTSMLNTALTPKRRPMRQQEVKE